MCACYSFLHIWFVTINLDEPFKNFIIILKNYNFMEASISRRR